jgi:hypothetical protein
MNDRDKFLVKLNTVIAHTAKAGLDSGLGFGVDQALGVEQQFLLGRRQGMNGRLQFSRVLFRFPNNTGIPEGKVVLSGSPIKK